MNGSSLKPTRPTHIPDYADACLSALAEGNLGDKISLGGAFALLHYLDYRSTFDVDAWWSDSATTKDREQVVETIKRVLGTYGQVRCQANMATPLQCWQLWRQRQQLTDDDDDVKRAKLAIVGHLERIEQYRPLTQIGEQEQRQEAARIRQWYREVLLDDTLA